MKYALIKRVIAEEKEALAKWGGTDDTPDILLNATLEELGEVAHAMNHDEGLAAIQQEIVETMGLLSRLYEMVEVYEKVPKAGA